MYILWRYALGMRIREIYTLLSKTLSNVLYRLPSRVIISDRAT